MVVSLVFVARTPPAFHRLDNWNKFKENENVLFLFERVSFNFLILTYYRRRICFNLPTNLTGRRTKLKLADHLERFQKPFLKIFLLTILDWAASSCRGMPFLSVQ
jgi:hypothetical protein